MTQPHPEKLHPGGDVGGGRTDGETEGRREGRREGDVFKFSRLRVDVLSLSLSIFTLNG